jgi:hypothetical protein
MAWYVRMQPTRTSIFASACIALLSTACSSDTSSATNQETADSGAPDPSEECPSDTPTLTDGTSGLQVADAKSGIAARIIKAQYLPPALATNDWTIAVTDATGAAMPNAQITWACAWMPVHGHGSNPKAVDKLGNGQFNLEKQNLSMYGGWEVQLWVNATGTGTDYAPQNGGGSLTGNACTPQGTTTGNPNLVFNVCVPRAR